MLFFLGGVFIFFYLGRLFGFLISFWGGGVMFDFYLWDHRGVTVSLNFLFDYLSFGFFRRISFISGLVFFYRVFYMNGTVSLRQFCWLVFLFVFSIFLLVYSGNFFMVLVGWDGLGLVSFCLVIFYMRHGSLESGLVTVFRNRVGDVFFLFRFYFFYLNGSWLHDFHSFYCFWLFGVFIFCGGITKSAPKKKPG